MSVNGGEMHMPTEEYKAVDQPTLGQFVDSMNVYGSNGWTLVSTHIVDRGGGLRFIALFKKAMRSLGSSSQGGGHPQS